ncbi:MAG: hypothetical protein OXC37_00760 [Bdellovibrionaceae bacterium]|nr:hypothetical protein [Pseudobdellovibrionaceae bacterium]
MSYKDFKFFINRHTIINRLRQYSHKLSFFINKHGRLLLILLISFAISDLLLIGSYNFLIPEKELLPLSVAYQDKKSLYSPNTYKIVWENNIFHTGPIPIELKTDSKSVEPIESSLPFSLKGTIIHANPRRSVATIQAGLENKSLSYQQGDFIEKQAEIKKIERAKVIFFNQNNNRLEYIIIPEEKAKLNISYQEKETQSKVPEQKDSLVKRQDNRFEMKRSDLNENLENLPEILSQARVVPHTENGELLGFRFAKIDKGSIYEDLGFEKGDIIKKVAGEFVTTPEQALELFERLKGGSGFKMLVEREGKELELEYNVNENAPIR